MFRSGARVDVRPPDRAETLLKRPCRGEDRMYLVSNIEYPATLYEPAAPEVNGAYHEDPEVNLSGDVGASQMYRTYNAQFLPASKLWALQDEPLVSALDETKTPS